MSSVVGSLFGGSSSEGLKAQRKANEASRTDVLNAVAQARQDATSLFPTAATNRNLGFQSALDVLGQTIPGQIDVFQQGNVGAQQALLAGLPQVQNAIFGLPTDLSGLQPQRLDVNTDFAQQQLPDFINPVGGLSGQPTGANGLPGGLDFGALPGGLGGGTGNPGAVGGGAQGDAPFRGLSGPPGPNPVAPFFDTHNASDLNRALGQPDIGSLAQLGLSENAGAIGRIAGALTGVPGLGAFGSFLGDRNLDNKVFMSPVNPFAPFTPALTTPGLADLFGGGLPNSPVGAGNTNPATGGGETEAQRRARLAAAALADG